MILYSLNVVSPTSSLSVDLEKYQHRNIRHMKDSLISLEEVDVSGEYCFEPNRAPLQRTMQLEIHSPVHSPNHLVTRPIDSCIPMLSVPSIEGPFQQRTLSRREKKMERKRASYKTKLCRNYMHGYCQFGSSCQFAHGDQELRVRTESIE